MRRLCPRAPHASRAAYDADGDGTVSLPEIMKFVMKANDEVCEATEVRAACSSCVVLAHASQVMQLSPDVISLLLSCWPPWTRTTTGR